MKYGCQKKGTGKAVLKAATGVMALASPILQNSPLAIQGKLMQQSVPVTKQRVNPNIQVTETREDKIKKESAKMKKGGMPPRKSKYFRKTESGAGMTQEGVMAYRRKNPGSKLKTAVTESNPGPKRAARRKSFCARSAGQMKMFPNAAKDPNSRLRQARRRWKC
jgi:hypothetical protein